jgi:hypothetical protein
MYVYTVTGLPTDLGRRMGFLPAPPPVVTTPEAATRGPTARSIRGLLHYWQGIPDPAALPDIDGPNPEGNTQPGLLSPNAWKPVIYWAEPEPAFCRTVAIRHHEDLPVPAVAPNANQPVPNAQRPPRFLGRGQIGWPRAFQRFPLIGGTNEAS